MEVVSTVTFISIIFVPVKHTIKYTPMFGTIKASSSGDIFDIARQCFFPRTCNCHEKSSCMHTDMAIATKPTGVISVSAKEMFVVSEDKSLYMYM